MALVSKNIPNFINGVSQQPPSLRLESQAEVQENGFSDVVDGLKKRPPTQYVKKLLKVDDYHQTGNPDGWQSPFNLYNENFTTPLTEYDLENAFFHTYKRSDDVQYQIVITPDKIVRVYDIDGNLRYESGSGSWLADGTHISSNSDDTSYLPDHYADITATSVADATFLVNKNKQVEKSNVISNPKSANDALVYLKKVNYGRDYTVKYTPKNGSTITGTATTLGQRNNIDAQTYTNDDELKVSTVISDLRGDLYNGVAAGESFPSQGTTDTSQPDTGNQVEAYRTISITSNSVKLSLTSTNAQVFVGGSTLPYDANGIDGWKFHADYGNGNYDIILPESVVTLISIRQYGAYYKYWTYRPSVTVNRLSSTSYARSILPATYSEEPFFIISSTQSDFDIIVTDDDGGVNLKAFKGTAKSFTDLPNQCIDGYRLGVVGDNQKKEDDFYVKFEGNAGSGFWRESTGYNQLDDLDLSTMPHTLNQDDNGAFSFGIARNNDNETWAKRLAGDDNTNPFPSFVGHKITDIFFHRNRLGVLAGENVVFSEAGGYLNFFRTTVRTLLDSDPIDVSVSQNEVADLQAAVPIQDNLLLFSSLNQFTLSAAQLLTPAEVTIDQSTKYECDLTATPVGAGTSVFFATKSGNFSGVREFFTKDDSEAKDAPEITTHVPKYIEGCITDIKASSNEDMLVALTDADKSECYIYKWYNSAEERLQSSWSKWKFNKDIASVFFNNANLYFTFTDGSYEKMDLAQSVDLKLLDHQIAVNVADAEALNAAVPENYINNDTVCVTESGLLLGTYNDNSAAVLAELGNNNTVIFGEPYTFKYQLSEQVFRPVDGDVTKLARFQLRKVSFNFSNTGKFDVTVDSVGRDPVVTHFTGRILGEAENVLGQASIVPEGKFAVGVLSKPDTTKITITNDTHLPSTFQSAEWEGFVVLRNQRL